MEGDIIEKIKQRGAQGDIEEIAQKALSGAYQPDKNEGGLLESKKLAEEGRKADEKSKELEIAMREFKDLENKEELLSTITFGKSEAGVKNYEEMMRKVEDRKEKEREQEGATRKVLRGGVKVAGKAMGAGVKAFKAEEKLTGEAMEKVLGFAKWFGVGLFHTLISELPSHLWKTAKLSARGLWRGLKGEKGPSFKEIWGEFFHKEEK